MPNLRSLLALCLFLGFAGSLAAQSAFAPGYLIDQNGERQAVYLSTERQDLFRGPIAYRTEAGGSTLTFSPTDVQGYGFTDSGERFERATVEDGDAEQVFLQLLVDGEADLFVLARGREETFYYRLAAGEVAQLRNGSRVDREGRSIPNPAYRQQLRVALACDFRNSSTDNLGYHRQDLIRYVSRYNECTGAPTQTFAADTVSRIQLVFQAGGESRHYAYSHPDRGTAGNLAFGPVYGLRIGLLAGFPFRLAGRETSIRTGVNFRAAEGDYATELESGYVRTSSFSLPLQLRWSVLTTERTARPYILAGLTLDFPTSGSNFRRLRTDYTPSAHTGYQLGAGLLLGSRWEVEAGYAGGRDVLRNYAESRLRERSVFISLGYRLGFGV